MNNQIVKSLAELNILNKEMKSLNKDYRKFSKQFDGLFRKYIGKMGRTRISNQEFANFKKISDERHKKDVDYPGIVTKELGINFLKWIRDNFAAVKAEEVVFYTKLNEMKQSINRRRPMNIKKGGHSNADGDSMDEDDSDDDYSEEEEE